MRQAKYCDQCGAKLKQGSVFCDECGAIMKSICTAPKKRTSATQNKPATFFDVEFSTTVLVWAGVALFFLFILLIAQSVM